MKEEQRFDLDFEIDSFTKKLGSGHLSYSDRMELVDHLQEETMALIQEGLCAEYIHDPQDPLADK